MCLSKSHFVLIFFICPLILAGADDHKRPDDYREEMRLFVRGISDYARQRHQGFLIIPQNGQELITTDGEPDSPLAFDYIEAIDGTGREDLFYGYQRDNRKTPRRDRDYLLHLCQLFRDAGKTVLVTDYCSDPDKMDNSYRLNREEGFISFAGPDRDLTLIPAYPDPIFNGNSDDITQLSQVRNFLYLINGDDFRNKEDLISAVSETDYDLIILDLFQYDEIFDSGDLDRLRRKKNGGQRLLLCYMSIGEAENYRYYWRDEWTKTSPSWLEKENPRWEGNFKVRYWEPSWQTIIFGRKDSYLDQILDAGFDGVYLDIIDGFEYFE